MESWVTPPQNPQPRYGAGLSAPLLRHKLLRLLRARPKQKLLHLPHQERPRLGFDRRQPVLIDQHGLMRHPLRPGFLGNAVVDALAELAGVRDVVEALGLALQENTVYFA